MNTAPVPIVALNAAAEHIFSCTYDDLSARAKLHVMNVARGVRDALTAEITVTMPSDLAALLTSQGLNPKYASGSEAFEERVACYELGRKAGPR